MESLVEFFGLYYGKISRNIEFVIAILKVLYLKLAMTNKEKLKIMLTLSKIPYNFVNLLFFFFLTEIEFFC